MARQQQRSAFSANKATRSMRSAPAVKSPPLAAEKTAQWQTLAVDLPKAYHQAVAEYNNAAPAQKSAVPAVPAPEVRVTETFKLRKLPASKAATEKGQSDGEPATSTASTKPVVLPPHLRARTIDAATAVPAVPVSAAVKPKVALPPHLRVKNSEGAFAATVPVLSFPAAAPKVVLPVAGPPKVLPPHLRAKKEVAPAATTTVPPLSPAKWGPEFNTGGFVPLHRVFRGSRLR